MGMGMERDLKPGMAWGDRDWGRDKGRCGMKGGGLGAWTERMN